MLEFQARQTRSAARLGLVYPADTSWIQIARHGLAYLREVLHDPEHGGWYWLAERSGKPLAASTKHAHSTAYLISAAVETYRLTADEAALRLATDAFDWLDDVLHGDADGGYHGWARRDGTPILAAEDVPGEYRSARDPLGHGIGLKDVNVHSDVLEALCLLAAVAPHLPRVGERLEEVYRLLTERFVTPGGAVHYMTHRDFSPVPGIERYGFPMQSGFRIVGAAILAGASLDAARDQARTMLDHALQHGWDEHRGGVFEAGPASEPSLINGVDLYVRRRPWWVQTETAKLTLLMARLVPDGGYGQRFERLLRVIDGEFIDHRHGGWWPIATGDWRLPRRIVRRGRAKADAWKDASHELDFYLASLRLLGPDQPNAHAVLTDLARPELDQL